MDQCIKPETTRIKEIGNRFDKEFKDDEAAVDSVFKQWPKNGNVSEVLVKTIVLNRLYNTSILNERIVARRIVELRIDDNLHNGEEHELIAQLTPIDFGKKTRKLYSFATKYCAWHQPDRFQMFDSKVEAALLHYQSHFKFFDFRRDELRCYKTFMKIIKAFRDHFNLTDVSPKNLDKFLWMEGRGIALPKRA